MDSLLLTLIIVNYNVQTKHLLCGILECLFWPSNSVLFLGRGIGFFHSDHTALVGTWVLFNYTASTGQRSSTQGRQIKILPQKGSFLLCWLRHPLHVCRRDSWTLSQNWLLTKLVIIAIQFYWSSHIAHFWRKAPRTVHHTERNSQTKHTF